MIVDKAARAKTYCQVDARQHEDDQIKHPADRRKSCQEEQDAGGKQEGGTNALRKAMWCRVILDDARSQQAQWHYHPLIEQTIWTDRRHQCAQYHYDGRYQHQPGLVKDKSQRRQQYGTSLRELPQMRIYTQDTFLSGSSVLHSRHSFGKAYSLQQYHLQ